MFFSNLKYLNRFESAINSKTTCIIILIMDMNRPCDKKKGHEPTKPAKNLSEPALKKFKYLDGSKWLIPEEPAPGKNQSKPN